MDNRETILNKMREIAQNSPEKIHIIETNVEAEMQIEFFETLQILNKQKDSPELEEIWDKLNKETSSFQEKKKA